MTEIPKISITQDFASDDESECSGTAANINEAHTDIEDLDSDEKSNRNQSFPSGQLLNARKKVKSKKIDDCATDIEDCEGSGSDEDLVKSCDGQLSLTEFLDQGNVEETSSYDGADKTKHSRKGKRASLFVPADDSGAVTDCEDIDTSDNEISIVDCQDDSAYNNFLLENDDFSSMNVDNSAFVQANKKKRLVATKRVEQSESDDDDENMARSNWNELSDVENVALSDQENQPHSYRMKHSASALDAEEMIMVASDNECAYTKDEPPPEIAVAFVNRRPKKTHSRAHGSKNKNLLGVQAGNVEEAVTDVENLDSSDDDSPNVRKSLTIPIAYVQGSKVLTDVEDFDVDDECIASTSADIKLPSPVREICVMREDSQGDPVAKVMPLVVSSNGSFLGVDEDYIDKG